MATKIGYENKETILTKSACTVQELINLLESFTDKADPDLIYIESGEADSVTVRLIENTLTDGSKTYDVRIS